MDIAATRQQDHQLGLSTNERRMKSYTVGIPKIISFDINVSKNSRKSDKRIQNTPLQYDDPSLLVSPPVYKKEPFSSGSDDVMHSANNATTHSDSIEMIDQEEKLKDLPKMLEKLASLNLNNEVKTVKPTGFVRSPEISPRRRASNRRTTGRMTPTLGSNRINAQTAPTSPITSPRSSPRSSIVIPDEIPLMEEKMMTTPTPSVLPPKRLVPSMKPPRQSLYDSNVARRPRNIAPIVPTQQGNDTLIHSTSSSSINKQEESECSKSATPLKRTITQYHRDIDGFIQELSTMEEEEEKETEEEEMVLKKVTLYKVLKQGDLMPSDLINHDAVNLYENGVVNWRMKEYEFDVPETSFCFHCDRNLKDTHFNRTVALTDHRHDILYGVLRCRIYRDINLCSECYYTNDHTEVIRITTQAKKMFVPIYHEDLSSS